MFKIKKIFVILSLFILNAFFVSNVYAASTTARAYINSSCNVRNGPGTNYDIIQGTNNEGAYYILVSDTTYKDENNYYNCSSDWYQVYYNGTATGYVCGDHVDVVYSYSSDDVTPSTTCEIEMSNLGFPSSYWGGLCALKERHPNWQFVALKIDYDWEYIVEKESSCGTNLIYGSTANSGFVDSSCNSYDSGYVGITQTGVAYYMDPRNFLSDRYIFQFEALSYDSSFSSIYNTAVTNIIKSAAFYTYHGSSLVTEIVNSSYSLNVSPIFTATRILQELGTSTSLYNLYSGVYTGYSNEYYGYYNFYNYGVSDSCVQSYGTTYCGLSYAKSNGWNSVSAAIKGGLTSIANNYIANNQNTLYLQKFNVNQSSSSKIATHQYMTNVAAPSSESATTYAAYRDLGILESSFIFYIPVYNNMDVTITNSSNGASGDTSSGSVSTLPISTIVTSSGYKYSSGYISGVTVGTSVSEIKSDITAISGSNTVTVYNASGSVVTSGNLATGYKIVIKNASSTETLQVVVKGDTSGDGVINALDLLQVQKAILGTYNLSGAYSLAGDTSGDGVVNALDLLQVQKSILGTYTISQ